jgi:hypothetical protein
VILLLTFLLRFSSECDQVSLNSLPDIAPDVVVAVGNLIDICSDPGMFRI